MIGSIEGGIWITPVWVGTGLLFAVGAVHVYVAVRRKWSQRKHEVVAAIYGACIVSAMLIASRLALPWEGMLAGLLTAVAGVGWGRLIAGVSESDSAARTRDRREDATKTE